MRRLLPVLILAVLGVGCGGVPKSGSTPSPAATQTSSSNPAPTSTSGAASGSPLPAPLVVTAGATQTVSGIDIAVATPAASPAPNAQDLGVNQQNVRGSASNTGGTLPRGNSMRVIIFGPGLSSSMQVRVSGPPDVSVSDLAAVQATDNTPGVSFTATANSNAALGARTVYLQNSQGDVTTFTGGLEVVK